MYAHKCVCVCVCVCVSAVLTDILNILHVNQRIPTSKKKSSNLINIEPKREKNQVKTINGYDRRR